MIIIENLKKNYKKIEVLSVGYFRFEREKTYLIIGSNGSGKSTLIKSIIGIIKYKGTIKKNCKYIGYIPDRFSDFPLIKVKTLLNNLLIDNKKLIGKDIIARLSHFFDLNNDKLLCNLSKGNKQKVLIIQALINDADLYIFDEPLNGLDYVNQEKFIQIIKYLKSLNKTIIITSHYPDYYRDCYDYKIFIQNGKIENELI